MDNSQSSDIFLENSMTENSPLYDKESYDCILIRTKKFFSTGALLNESTFSLNFLSSLEDCYNCISQCLETIVSMLGNSSTQLPEISTFIGDAISLLQMLSHFIKNIIEALVMTCSVLSSFPTTTGKIILIVFTHCKDSESVYGIHLNSVEKQLKELFRSCHELQLIYLMTLEKHFIFDMNDKEDQSILLAALDINLRIGEIVQALDVKTMAEQWKAYTAICEKYSNGLIDKNVYNNCTELLSTIVEENIKNAFENEDQEKVVLRSLKVASFTLKIILKVSNVFKHEPNNNYEYLFQMLINIHYMCDSSILEIMSNKSPQFISQVNLLVLNTTQILLSQLLPDNQFFNCLMQYDIRNVKGGKQLGYVLLLMSTVRGILKTSEEQTTTLSKSMLIDCVLNTLPYIHCYFYTGLRFKLNENEDSCGFEQHILMHVVALCMNLNSEEFAVVERRLYESILGVNYTDALFSSKLWVLLSRVASRQYTLSCITNLCTTYEKLEKNNLFHNAPQQIHLTETIAGMFEHLPDEEKVVLSKQLGIQSESRYNLLSILKIKNFPINLRMTIEDSVMEKLLINLNKLNNANLNEVQDIKKMTDLIYIASSCSTIEANSYFEECITKAWLKACPRNLFDFPSNIDPGIHWYYTFLRALISLTDVSIENFNNFDNAINIHNVLTSVILTRNNELTLSAIAFYCKLSFDLFSDIQNSELDSTIHEIFSHLLLETEPLTKECALSELFMYRQRRRFKTIIFKIITERLDLKEIWDSMTFENHTKPNEKSRQRIKYTANNSFIHKCVQNKHNYDDCSTLKKKKAQSNFEMDIDELFEGESDSDEPAPKKAKVDSGADIVKRLEVDSLLLSQCDVSDEYKKRIAVVCDTLRNIICD